MNVTLIWKERRSEKKAKTKEARRTFKNVHVANEEEALKWADVQAETLKIRDYKVEVGEESADVGEGEK